MNKKQKSNTLVKKEDHLLTRIIVSLSIIIVLAVLGFFVTKKITQTINSKINISSIYELWEQKDYLAVFDKSSEMLLQKPFNPTALAYKGYAAFCLAISQNELEKAQEYIESSINSLRLACQNPPETLESQICYMLGKAYFQKNLLSAYYYYSDSAIYYLNRALELGYEASDIYEYLGLSYANLNMNEESIKAFSNALLTSENDTLLLAIAEQYIKNSQTGNAMQYLYRIRSLSKDDSMVLKASLLLANIYLEEQNYQDAIAEYESILQKDSNNADAFYGIGLVYEQMGDLVKARAEWRKALKAQANHQGAYIKLNT